MAIKMGLNSATIFRPGYYGDPTLTPYYMKYGTLLQFLAKLNIRHSL